MNNLLSATLEINGRLYLGIYSVNCSSVILAKFIPLECEGVLGFVWIAPSIVLLLQSVVATDKSNKCVRSKVRLLSLMIPPDHRHQLQIIPNLLPGESLICFKQLDFGLQLICTNLSCSLLVTDSYALSADILWIEVTLFCFLTFPKAVAELKVIAKVFVLHSPGIRGEATDIYSCLDFIGKPTRDAGFIEG
jgi:hypothetical protein